MDKGSEVFKDKDEAKSEAKDPQESTEIVHLVEPLLEAVSDERPATSAELEATTSDADVAAAATAVAARATTEATEATETNEAAEEHGIEQGSEQDGIDGDSTVEVDYNGMPPPPEVSYPSLAELMVACQEHGRQHGYACVTASNNYKRGIAYVRCDRGGQYVNHWNVTKENRVRHNRTRRLVGCKWKARAKRNGANGEWELTMMHNRHTGHGPSSNLASHPSLRQLPDEAIEAAKEAFLEGRLPKDVRQILRRWNDAVTSQDVYNLKAKLFRRTGELSDVPFIRRRISQQIGLLGGRQSSSHRQFPSQSQIPSQSGSHLDSISKSSTPSLSQPLMLADQAPSPKWEQESSSAASLRSVDNSSVDPALCRNTDATYHAVKGPRDVTNEELTGEKNRLTSPMAKMVDSANLVDKEFLAEAIQ